MTFSENISPFRYTPQEHYLMDGTAGLEERLFEPYETLLDQYDADCYLIDMD